jgi:hypothetical protein
VEYILGHERGIYWFCWSFGNNWNLKRTITWVFKSAYRILSFKIIIPKSELRRSMAYRVHHSQYSNPATDYKHTHVFCGGYIIDISVTGFTGIFNGWHIYWNTTNGFLRTYGSSVSGITSSPSVSRSPGTTILLYLINALLLNEARRGDESHQLPADRHISHRSAWRLSTVQPPVLAARTGR